MEFVDLDQPWPELCSLESQLASLNENWKVSTQIGNMDDQEFWAMT